MCWDGKVAVLRIVLCLCLSPLAARLTDAACCLCESVYTWMFVCIWKPVGVSHHGFATQLGLWESKQNSFLLFCLQEGLCTAHLPRALSARFTASDCLCAFSLFCLFLYFSWIIRWLFNTLARHYSWILWFFSPWRIATYLLLQSRGFDTGTRAKEISVFFEHFYNKSPYSLGEFVVM